MRPNWLAQMALALGLFTVLLILGGVLLLELLEWAAGELAP